MADPKEEYARIKEALAAADGAMVDALEKRAVAVRDLIRLRERDPDGYYVLPRAEDVLPTVRQRLKEWAPQSAETVFREVLSACEAMMAPRTIAYAGSEGGFAHAAARKHFGASATFRAAASVGAVLEEVARGRASGGVVPLETSTDGAVTATLHGLVQAEVKICAELTIPASYHLVSETGNASDIEKIYGATHAVAACEHFLRERFPRATVLDVPSADVAAQFAKEDHGAAAIATDIVVSTHDLRIIHERMEDVTGVETRFAVVGHDLPPRTGHDRTVLAMAVGDAPGSLHRSLQPFADRSINLTRLESRPSHGTAWHNVFFLELDGHVTDRPVLTCIEDVRAVSRMVKILGSYPRPT